MNHVVISGRLTADPTLRGEGQQFVTFSVAVQRPAARQDDGSWRDSEPDYVDCLASGTLATRIASKLRRGERIYCVGRLTLSRFITRDGRKASALRIWVNSAESESFFKKGSETPAPEENGQLEVEPQPVEEKKPKPRTRRRTA